MVRAAEAVPASGGNRGGDEVTYAKDVEIVGTILTRWQRFRQWVVQMTRWR